MNETRFCLDVPARSVFIPLRASHGGVEFYVRSYLVFIRTYLKIRENL